MEPTQNSHFCEYTLSQDENAALRAAFIKKLDDLRERFPHRSGGALVPPEQRAELMREMVALLDEASPSLRAAAQDYFEKKGEWSKASLLFHNLPFERDKKWFAVDITVDNKWLIRCHADLFRLAMESIDRDGEYLEHDNVPVNNRRVSPDSMKGQFPHMDFKFGHVTFACLEGNKGAQTFVFDADIAAKSLRAEQLELLQQPLFTVRLPVVDNLAKIAGSKDIHAPLLRKIEGTEAYGLVFNGALYKGILPYLSTLAPNPELKREDPELFAKAKEACTDFKRALLDQKQAVTLEDNDFLMLDQRRTLHAGSLHRSLNMNRWVRIAGWGEEKATTSRSGSER